MNNTRGDKDKKFKFYGFNPRMIPLDVNPKCKIVKNEKMDADINNNSLSVNDSFVDEKDD
jgi:hypothetical protein